MCEVPRNCVLIFLLYFYWNTANKYLEYLDSKRFKIGTNGEVGQAREDAWGFQTNSNMTAMNPYAFRGWHLSTYPDTANCDRNYPMYNSWPSTYFNPASMYSLQPDAVTQKQHNSSDWKLQPICSSSSSSDSVAQRDANLLKSGYESLLYKSNCNRVDTDTPREDCQRSCCAISCTCNSHQRLNVLDNAWRGTDMVSALDLNKANSVSAYQSLCQRGLYIPFYNHQFCFPSFCVTFFLYFLI